MDFQTVCPYPKRIFNIPKHLVVLEQHNYSSQCSSCVFFRKIEVKIFWMIEAISETSTTNAIMNLSHTLYVNADAKALCSILFSSEDV